MPGWLGKAAEVKPAILARMGGASARLMVFSKCLLTNGRVRNDI